jgi:hypothetical protein
VDFITALMGIVVYAIPFVILYFVVAAAVKKGIETSEVGRVILQKHVEETNNNRK